MNTGPTGRVLALSGGVGGAKLSLGLAQVVAANNLHILVNTGDDFEHLGLHISPDIDTLLYTLGGVANKTLGWGLEGETFATMNALETLGGESWFRLGDRDMATHLWRSQQLAQGRSLLELTADLATRLGVGPSVHPMCEERVRTTVLCDAGRLPFQHYFVRRQCEPAVSGFVFEGIAQAKPNANVVRLLESGDVSNIIICPSNPYVSIDPILQVAGVWEALRDADAPVVLVSPIVAGMAIKGPAAKMMAELDVPVTALGVAQHYCNRYPGLLDYFIVDESDAMLAGEISELGVKAIVAPTVMKSLAHKRELANYCLALGEE